MKISMILDTSGSMAELAKPKILQGILDFYQQYELNFEKKIELTYYKWNAEGILSITAQQTKQLEYCAKNNLESVIDYVDQHQEDKIVLISDGCFLETEIHLLQSALKKNKLNFFRVICIGTDDKRRLYHSKFGKSHVFDVEDISQVIPSLIFKKTLDITDLMTLIPS